MTTQPNAPEDHGVADESSGHEWRLGRFPNLMPRRVEQILLVSTAYDAFTLEEDGLLTELIYSEYVDLSLTHAPRVTRVATGEAALEALHEQRFDLVITMLRIGDMDVRRFAAEARRLRPGLPVVLLIVNELELARLGDRHDLENIESVYVWHGDAKLFLVIIKAIEDMWNADHDTQVGGVGVIILVEDSVRYRSSMLPMLYSELVEQTRAVMLDGINRMQRQLRLRARPKILVAETYDEAIDLYQRYRDCIFGVITDVRYHKGEHQEPLAGLLLIEEIRRDNPDVPVLLQSSEAQNRALAAKAGVAFLHKRSNTLLQDMQQFMLSNFGFGDFIFRRADGVEVGRASNLHEMVHKLGSVPVESVHLHALRNHFSNWLRARTEFALARRLRPRRVSEFEDMEALRRYLIASFQDAIRLSRLGAIEDFNRDRFDLSCSFARLGGGSLGGKARGLAFFDAMLVRHELHRAFENVRVLVPRSVVIGTDVFDEFLEENRLRSTALYHGDDEWVKSEFLSRPLPERIVEDLRAYLHSVQYPIAVRSSSLLEDSQYYPFAGVYETLMIPNNQPDFERRLAQLCDAVRLVYASTYSTAARKYLESTPHRIEEQKMGVILQQIVGAQHDHYFYPDFAGVLRSYNFYPFGHMKPEDGVAIVGLGLGQLVVQGGEALRFSPAYPHVLPQLALGRRFVDQSQRGFYAIDLLRGEGGPAAPGEPIVVRLPLADAEAHGTLAAIGSTWAPEDDAFYDGIYRPGVRVVTFAHVLKSGVFPLAEILHRVMALGRDGLGGPVEIEFAANLSSTPRELAILQLRPYGISGEQEAVQIEGVSREAMVCFSAQSLGNGRLVGMRDIIYVKPDAFDAARTEQIAQEIASVSDQLRADRRTCVLIGPGRWGSSNHWLGIPVAWGQISTARVIVETTLDNFLVDPSQGSHFFHNLTSSGAAYLTINPRLDGGFIDWAWLANLPSVSETSFIRHVRLDHELEARVDGRSSRAAVLKRITPLVA